MVKLHIRPSRQRGTGLVERRVVALLDLFAPEVKPPLPIQANTDPQVICAPVEGTPVPLSQVPDPVFASGMLGQGIGLKTSSNIAFSPVSGTVTAVVNTKHAVAIRGENGAEVLLHVGVDTVRLHGQGFSLFVKNGSRVKAGDPLIAFDRALIAEKNLDDTVIVTVTNAGDFSQVRPVSEPKVTAGGALLKVER